MKNKVDKEYVVLFVVALIFSSVVPFTVTKAYYYFDDYYNGLFYQAHWGKTEYDIFTNILHGVFLYMPAIATAALIMIAVRYSFKWFALSILPLTIYSIITNMRNILSWLNTVYTHLNNPNRFLTNSLIFSFIIIIIIQIFLFPFLWFVFSRIFEKYRLAETKLFIVVSTISMLLDVITTIILILGFYPTIFRSTNSFNYLQHILSNDLVSYIIIIASYFLFKWIFKKLQKTIRIEALASE